MPQGPQVGFPTGCISALLGCGLSPFRPALTDVLISQAGRPRPLGMNFWGPMGTSFSGTKREKETLGRSCSCHCSLGDIVGGLGLGKDPDLCEMVGLGVECTVSPNPRGTGPKPHGRRMGQFCSGCDRETSLPGKTCSGQGSQALMTSGRNFLPGWAQEPGAERGVSSIQWAVVLGAVPREDAGDLEPAL